MIWGYITALALAYLEFIDDTVNAISINKYCLLPTIKKQNLGKNYSLAERRLLKPQENGLVTATLMFFPDLQTA